MSAPRLPVPSPVSFLMAAALLAVVVLLSFRLGRYPLPTGDIATMVWAKVTGEPAAIDPVAAAVIWNIRLPRVIAGLLVGAALAGAGATYQGMFRNPLVSPDILGVSAGAGAGAVLGIFLSLPALFVQTLAFGGGLLAVGAVYAVAGLVRRQDPSLVLILVGIAIAALLTAAISLLKVLADPYNQLPAITFWLLGGLNAVTPDDVQVAAPAILLGILPLYLLRWRVNLLTLGEEEAMTLGVETRVLRLALVAAATLMTAAAVAISGIIGWVGLIVPHVARLLVGPDFTRLMPASLMLGAGFVVAVDCLARTAGPMEVPLGIVTAVVGAPFFLWLLTTRRG